MTLRDAKVLAARQGDLQGFNTGHLVVFQDLVERLDCLDIESRREAMRALLATYCVRCGIKRARDTPRTSLFCIACTQEVSAYDMDVGF